MSFGEGEAVFLPQGGQSPYLQHIASVLRGIRDGAEFGSAMFAMFDSMGLIQPVNLDVQLDDKNRVGVSGLHGIDRERLAALDAHRCSARTRQATSKAPTWCWPRYTTCAG